MRFTSIFVVLLAGCSSASVPVPIIASPELRDFRGIIHCHSRYSHDSQGTYEEILAAAKAAKVDFICMTDHPPSGDKGRPLREGWTGIHDGVLFIQGAEYSDQILGLGLRDPISGKDRRETIRAIHAQGGVAIACHPEEIDDWDAYAEADGMEIYNVHATLKRKSKDKTFMLRVAKAIKEDPEHSFQLLQDLDPAIVRKWDEINRTHPFTGIAGNDAHQNVSFFGLQLDPYPRAFRFVATHVLAEDLTQEAVLGALRAGRAYVAFSEEQSGLVRGQGLDWVGEEIAGSGWRPYPHFKPALGYGDLHCRWLRDGEEVPSPQERRSPATRGPDGRILEGLLQWRRGEPGRYRYEVLREDAAPVLLTNPVRFR
ncbi:MAG TPA: PHP domain-containing protein [Planctomycetota bacterium]|nr:PHP domain-containing protein [Planctomycetota bacterium]